MPGRRDTPRTVRTGRRKARFALHLCAVALILTLFPPGVAEAHCPGTQVVDHVQGYDQDRGSTVRGVQGNIFVNNFDVNHQFWTIRALAVVQTAAVPSPDFVEVGWFKRESVGTKRVFKARSNNGVYDIQLFDGSSLNNGVFRGFKVHDQNANQFWSFAYRGDSLGNEFSSFNTGEGRTNTETHCTSDSASAEYRNLRDFSCIGCSFGAFQDLRLQFDNNGNYDFCRISSTRHTVRQNC